MCNFNFFNLCSSRLFKCNSGSKIWRIRNRNWYICYLDWKNLFLSAAFICIILCILSCVDTHTSYKTVEQRTERKAGGQGAGTYDKLILLSATKKCKLYLVIVPFVESIRWGYFSILCTDMRVWFHDFNQRWSQFFPRFVNIKQPPSFH